MTTKHRHLRRMILAAAVTVAPTISLAAAAASSAPTPPTVAKDLACVWVGQLSTGVCVQPPTQDAPNAIH